MWNFSAERNMSLEEDLSAGSRNDTNATDYTGHEGENSLSYKIIATTLHVLILVGGLFGNIVLVLVVRKTRSLHTPTYYYLISLACADLIVLISAMPEAIMSHHIDGYVFGQIGCSLHIFSNFLGINAGSLSILAFTVERYVAIMQPLRAQKVCTVGHARKVIIGVWIFSLFYCAPWLGLTKITYPDGLRNPDVQFCDLRLSPEQYSYFFMTDLVLFYFVPLFVAATVYTKIACKLRSRTAKSCRRSEKRKLDVTGIQTINSEFSSSSLTKSTRSTMSVRSSTRNGKNKSQSHALSMLVVVVVLFAVCWLPYRGLLVYNSIAALERPWLDIWYLLFAKTLIYLNSTINPFLYNIMTRRFREAVFRYLGLKKSRPEPCRSFV